MINNTSGGILVYRNFGLAIFFTAYCIDSISSVDELDRQMSFFYKHMQISKVYLETHRDSKDISADKLSAFRKYFESRGIKASGAITTTLPREVSSKQFFDTTGGFASNATTSSAMTADSEKIMTWSTICYTDSENRARLQKICETAASVFDEFILDDFYFTSCTCDRCISAKGDLSWEDYRLKLMSDVSENVIVKPAKAVNPSVNVIIKYPNWYEAYQETGYNTETEPLIFDDIYTGIETRDPVHSKQHLPRYESYLIMRYLENVSPGHNRGGWADWLDSEQSLNFYIEQAYFSLFAKSRELMLFCYGGIQDSVFVPSLGFALEKLDESIGSTGNPKGIAAYLPHHSHGEDHLLDYLGMTGLPFEPYPEFPTANGMIFISEDASCDDQIIEKLKAHLNAGKDVCITSGFLRAMQGRGIEDLTSARYTDRKAASDVYNIWENSSCFDSSFIRGHMVTVPFINFMNNSSDCLISLCKGDNNFPLLIKDSYSNGIVYTLTIPDDYSDIYNYPHEILSCIRQLLMRDLGIYLEGKEKICLFLYDNNTFIVESCLGYACRSRIHIAGHGRKLKDIRTGQELSPIYELDGESVFELYTLPLKYSMFQIIV